MTLESKTVASTERKASLWTTISAVLWAFLGVRRKSDFEKDIGRLTPMQIAIVGAAGGVVFVLILVAIVAWVVGDMPSAAPL